MDQLYPIIRRARRPLLPPDELQPRVILPVTMEPEPVEAVPIVVATAEPAPESVVPPSRRPRKERKHAQAPPT